MASVKDIAPLQAETDQETIVEETQSVVEQEVLKLGQSIQESSSLGLQAATQTVIGNIPEMIRELTDDIKSGSIDNFSTAMNKLIKLVNDLGINLRDYNEDLADTVDKFTNKQMKLEDKLSQWREMGLKAEIKNGEVRLLTQRDVFKAQKEKIKNEKLIETKIAARDKLQANIDNKVWENSKSRTEAQKKIVENEEQIAQLRLDNEEIDKKTGTTTADTGRDTGMSKFTELKEAFMVIPDTIGDAMTSFGKAGKGMFTGLTGLFKKGGLVKAFKGLAGFFKTARIMIMAKFLLVIAAFQFLAEKIDSIVAFFKKIWDKISGFFKAIGDWISDSWIGRKLGLGGDDEGEEDKSKSDGSGLKKKADESTKDLKALYIKNYGEEEGTKLYEEWEQEQGFAEKPKIKAKNPRKFETKKTEIVPQDDDKGEVTYQRTRGGNKKFFKKKTVTGNELVGDGETSSMLKSLESESNNIKPPTIINVQNNTNQNNSHTNASNVSGFIHHEPDESFKFVKQGTTGSNDF